MRAWVTVYAITAVSPLPQRSTVAPSQQDPYSPYLLNKLAVVLMAQGEWLQALPHLQRAQQLSSDDAGTYTNLGRLYVALQDYAQARAALLEAVQINPFDPAIHMQLTEIYRQLGTVR